MLFRSLLLQLRDDIPGILAPGKIGLFGGHCEDNETGLDCAVREIAEETSYAVPRQRFRLLTRYAGPDLDGTSGQLDAEIYIVRDIPVERLTITEGSLLSISKNDIPRLKEKMTGLTYLCMQAYLNQRPIAE